MKNFWKNNRGIVLFLILMLFFRSAIADWYHVPTGSMQPNILIGDRVWVNKLAYDAKIPFSNINLSRHAEPQVGDVVVFQSKQVGERLIKRVIAMPGDTIEMQNNHLKINGQWLNVEALELEQKFDQFMQDRDRAIYYQELIGASKNSVDLKYPIRLSLEQKSSFSSFRERVVPEEHFMVLGDNRDNSSDSRFIGMIPRSELLGRAERVIISFDLDDYYLPRNGRYMQKL
jgi:signal peptidase I